MSRPGRKPLADRHVERLSGSELAKLRLMVILQTMRGELTIPEAAARLGVCESRFHAMRHQWLEEALQLLEPRPLGRPVTAKPEASEDTLAELRIEVERLRKELAISQVAREVESILSGAIDEEHPSSSASSQQSAEVDAKKKRIARRKRKEKQRRNKGNR